jgi:hypothetical protein
MKIISLSQPFASLIVIGAKRFETRGWQPGWKNALLMRTDGFLIHASQKPGLIPDLPLRYAIEMGKLSFGAILGRAKLGRIISTEEWLKEFGETAGKLIESKMVDEFHFGDYSPKRWAWELLEVERFAEPIPCRGSLSIWNYPFSPAEKASASLRT